MKQHPLFGRLAILRTQESLPENSFLNFAAEIAEYHHENGMEAATRTALKARAFPLSASWRSRTYTTPAFLRGRIKPLSHEETVDIIRRGSASSILNWSRFFCRKKPFNKIATQYKGMRRAGTVDADKRIRRAYSEKVYKKSAKS